MGEYVFMIAAAFPNLISIRIGLGGDAHDILPRQAEPALAVNGQIPAVTDHSLGGSEGLLGQRRQVAGILSLATAVQFLDRLIGTESNALALVGIVAEQGQLVSNIDIGVSIGTVADLDTEIFP